MNSNYVKIILIILFSVSYSGCHDNTVTDGLKPIRTVIAGEVVNAGTSTVNAIRCNICDPFENKTEYCFLGETGNKFLVEHDYMFAQNMTMFYGGHFLNVFINPGDSVYVKIDASKLGAENAVVFSGDNAGFNNDFYKWFLNNRDYGMPEAKEGQAVEEFREIMLENIAVRKRILDEYRGKNGMSDDYDV